MSTIHSSIERLKKNLLCVQQQTDLYNVIVGLALNGILVDLSILRSSRRMLHQLLGTKISGRQGMQIHAYLKGVLRRESLFRVTLKSTGSQVT